MDKQLLEFRLLGAVVHFSKFPNLCELVVRQLVWALAHYASEHAKLQGNLFVLKDHTQNIFRVRTTLDLRWMVKFWQKKTFSVLD